jgi:adenine-specific DNA methylase
MATKKEQVAQELARAVGAGKAIALETVDFNDPNRPKTCLEVDFPILRINELAAIEASSGATKKPIYQAGKWWARRQPSVFRSTLIAAATIAPTDKAHAARVVWDNYYANHQKKGAFKHIRVADIFMGGGTTVVEGSRLGMQMIGNDLNPVAWFVVKQELADVNVDEVKRFLDDIEAHVKPQLMPYYCCDGPNGEKGKWTNVRSNLVMPADFDPLSLTLEQRHDYRYEGPEVIYTFWAKHGPCQVTGCGHRTPIMTSPVMAVKTLTVKHWEHTCGKCGHDFHIEEVDARMAPDVPLYVAPNEYPFSTLDPKRGVVCPHCGQAAMLKLGKGKNKKIELSLLVHPQWLAGSPRSDAAGEAFGGAAQDESIPTEKWNLERAAKVRLLEVRGTLPETVVCPETGIEFRTDKAGGNVPKQSTFACASCGTLQDVMLSVRTSAKTGPMAPFALHCFSKQAKDSSAAYNGRFFLPFDEKHAKQLNAATSEWHSRKIGDLGAYWPQEQLIHYDRGNTSMLYNQPQHGHTHWWTMFNPRQLLGHSLLLKAIMTLEGYSNDVREFVLIAFQQYLRNNNSYSFWNLQADQLEPLFSNNNYHPKSLPVENNFFGPMGRGNWHSCVEGLVESAEWRNDPWETVSIAEVTKIAPSIASLCNGKSEKVWPGDPVGKAEIGCHSSTDLSTIDALSMDLVITDPPFGALIHYADLADFFYPWLRTALRERYPDTFRTEHTPRAVEVIANKALEEDADAYYQRLLTQCWSEAHRILKPGGILAFTFHHSKDEPWIAVLESLFDAGFYLEATYPIRSDETKGEGSKPGTFGSQQIEYDILHVCRKRTEEPNPVSWGRMRREVMADVRQLQSMLENHAKEGLPAADIQVIRRGKALEYFSRHYGKVYVDEGRAISVKDALVGINQLIDEDADKGKEPPPVNAEPITRQFLRTFGNATEIMRDQLQKFLKGSITTPDEFEQRGWCTEKSKVFIRVNPLDFAREWSGKHRRRLTSDLDQALVLIGACFDGSGINASDTLKNENFKPHVALKPLLEWLHKNGPDQASRNAASRAVSIYNGWAATQAVKPKQGALFEEYEL